MQIKAKRRYPVENEKRPFPFRRESCSLKAKSSLSPPSGFSPLPASSSACGPAAAGAKEATDASRRTSLGPFTGGDKPGRPLAARRRAAVRILLLLLGLLLAPPCRTPAQEAKTLHAPGDKLVRLELTDQHGRRGAVDEQTALLVFLPDRAAGKLLHAALAKAPPGILEAHHAVCIADISGMPVLVARFIALPKMRGYPYPLFLVDSAERVARLPRRAGEATLLRLDGLRIVNLDFAQTPEAIAAALAPPEADAPMSRPPLTQTDGNDKGEAPE